MTQVVVTEVSVVNTARRAPVFGVARVSEVINLVSRQTASGRVKRLGATFLRGATFLSGATFLNGNARGGALLPLYFSTCT